MNIRITAFLFLLGGACHAASITGSIAADPGAARNLTALGTVDWAHFGFSGTGGGGPNPLATEKIGGTAIGTPTSTIGIFKFYSGSPNTYNWTDGTPNLAASIANGMYINDGLANRFGEIILPVAASSTAQRLVLFLASQFFFGSGGASDPISTLTASLNDGSGATFTINNITGRNMVTLDFTANGASTLSVSLGTNSLSNSGSPNTLILDAAYLQLGPDNGGGGGVPEPSSFALAAVGALALAGWRKLVSSHPGRPGGSMDT